MLIPNEIEIHPCVIVGQDSEGRDEMEQCDENDPNIACWGLYVHIDQRGLMHVKDFNTKAEAEHGAELLNLFMEALDMKS